MGLKGDLLELIAESPGSLRTFQGQFRKWTHLDRAHQAFERQFQGRGRTVSVSSSGEPPETTEEHLNVWLEGTSRWNIAGDGHVDVSDGVHRWIGGNGRVTVSEQDVPNLDATGFGILIAPGRQLLGTMAFGTPEEDEVSERMCWKVSASTALNPQRGPLIPGMGLAGIDHTIWFDAITGMIVCHIGTFQGERCSVSEFSDIQINEPIDEARFTYAPDPSTTVERRIDRLVRMAEQRGVDLCGIDRNDESAVQGAMHADLRPHFQTPESTKIARRAKHVPMGPPPVDEAEAAAAIEYAYQHNNEVAEDGTTLVNVQRGESLAEPLKQAGTRVPSTASSDVKMVVDDILFLRPDEAVVWFGVEVDGQRFAMVDGREGRAVLVAGRWLIEHATLVDLIGFAGVTAPTLRSR